MIRQIKKWIKGFSQAHLNAVMSQSLSPRSQWRVNGVLLLGEACSPERDNAKISSLSQELQLQLVLN